MCWYAAVIRVTYVGLLGMAADSGRRRGTYSIFNSQSSMKIMVKKCLLGSGPLAVGLGMRACGAVLSCWQDGL